MIKVHQKYKASVMAAMKVKKNNVSRWGIYKINKRLNKRNFIIDGVIEKPSEKKAPSNNAVIGRYILPRTIFNKIKSFFLFFYKHTFCRRSYFGARKL